MAENEKVYHSMDEFLADLMPRLHAWREEQRTKWEGKSCDACGSKDALAWCENRHVIECRFCGGYVRGTEYVP